MTKKSFTSLDHDEIVLLVAVIELLHSIIELVIKVVSYDSCNSQLRV